MRRFIFPFLAAAVITSLVACKRKTAPQPEAEPVPQTKPQADLAPGTAPPASSAPVVSASPATSIPQAKPGSSEASPPNSELTDAVYRFRDKFKRLPASWQELVQAGFLKAVPTPPHGVRYAIDPISAMVVEVKVK